MAQDDLYRLTQLGAWAPEGSREAQLHSLYDWVFKLLGTSPLTDAGQAVGVAAVGENPNLLSEADAFSRITSMQMLHTLSWLAWKANAFSISCSNVDIHI